MDARDFYDVLGSDYDTMVAWEARLAREEAFFKRLFDHARSRRVLDAACGTGMHAVAFSRMGRPAGHGSPGCAPEGREAAGADVSPVMVERARANALAAGLSVDFRVAGFGGIAAAFGGGWDAVTCLGNSLPHCADDAALAACLADFASLLRPGGLLVVQNRNYDRLLRERTRLMPLAVRGQGEEETLFLRITDFPPAGSPQEESLTFTIVTLRRRGDSWAQESKSTPLRALRRATQERALAEAGFTGVEAFGGYDGAPFDAPASTDLVLVARLGTPR
jgi:glycine/sarcosine N-methyltransferase